MPGTSSRSSFDTQIRVHLHSRPSGKGCGPSIRPCRWIGSIPWPSGWVVPGSPALPDYSPAWFRCIQTNISLTTYPQYECNCRTCCMRLGFQYHRVRGHPKAASEGHFKTGHFQEPLRAASLVGCADGPCTENGEETNGCGAIEAGLVVSADRARNRSSLRDCSPT